MTLFESIVAPQRRLNLYRGLVLDVPTWESAHDYHRTQQRTHNLTMHTPGIVAGLEVTAGDASENLVVIHPGVAVDRIGQTIVVTEPQRLQLNLQEARTMHLILQYREILGDLVQVPGSDEAQPRFTLEAYRVEERHQLPEDAFIELARVQISGTGALVSNAADGRKPQLDEIDLRHRPISGPCPMGRIAIGLVDMEGISGEGLHHASGTMNLIWLINATTAFRAEFKGVFDLSRESGEFDVLLMTGQKEFDLGRDAEQNLRGFLDLGGTLIGESCGQGLANSRDASPFQESFLKLAGNLGRNLAAVTSGHPLLNALHIFPVTPEGIEQPGEVLAGNGIVFSGSDYGCLWDGGWADRPVSRETVRSATELGINLGVMASRSRQLHTLAQMSREPA